MLAFQLWTTQTADRELIKRCKRAIQSLVPTAKIVLYGSRARGDATGNSDYDLLVLMDRPVDMTLREGLIECIYPIELDTGAVITLMTYNLNEWESSRYQAMPFHKNVERDGVLL